MVQYALFENDNWKNKDGYKYSQHIKNSNLGIKPQKSFLDSSLTSKSLKNQRLYGFIFGKLIK